MEKITPLERHIREDFIPLKESHDKLQESHDKRGAVHIENNLRQKELLIAFAKSEEEKKKFYELIIGAVTDIKSIKESMTESRSTSKWIIGLAIQALWPILGIIYLVGKSMGKL